MAEEDKIIELIAKKIEERQKLPKILFRQLLLGIAYGLGASIGAAIIGGFLIYIYRNILSGFVQ